MYGVLLVYENGSIHVQITLAPDDHSTLHLVVTVDGIPSPILPIPLEALRAFLEANLHG